jgi:hypothetical protein
MNLSNIQNPESDVRSADDDHDHEAANRVIQPLRVWVEACLAVKDAKVRRSGQIHSCLCWPLIPMEYYKSTGISRHRNVYALALFLRLYSLVYKYTDKCS